MSREAHAIWMQEPAGPPAPVRRAEPQPESDPAEPRPEQASQSDARGERSVQPREAEPHAGQEATAATTGVESRPIPPPEPGGGFGNLPNYLAIFGFVVLLYTLLRAYRRSASRRAERGDPKEQIQSVRDDAAKRARSSVDHAAAETLDMIERLSAQLDNKAARLEMLLAEADRRIDELHRLRRQTPEPHRPLRDDSRDDRSAETEGGDPVRSRVYEMADRGVSAEEISRAVQRPRGQVDLMLALRRV